MTVLQSGFGSSGGYEIDNSLRFRASASPYLLRTPGSQTNTKAWTLSGWVKRGNLSAVNVILATQVASNNGEYISFNASGSLEIGLYNGVDITLFRSSTALFRDPSAHYHVLVAWDSANATAQNRIRAYVNGNEITAWNINTTVPLNADSFVNRTVPHAIGAVAAVSIRGAVPLDGYLSEVNFIDGQALDPTSFGEFDAVTGVWVPKKYTGSYGTNGFYLPFNDATSLSTLTADASGNGNNWTANNISLTAGSTYDHMEDTPTNNYAVLNPIRALQGTGGTFSNANLRIAAANDLVYMSTMPIPSTGKWYAEMTVDAIGSAVLWGIRNYQGVSNQEISYQNNGNRNPGPTAYGATYTVGDVIGAAVDCDTQQITFYKNNVSQGALAFSTGSLSPSDIIFAGYVTGTGSAVAVNFGQRPFAYTPPTGFKALCTKNTGAITPISSGTFTGNLNADGPFVWLAGTPNSMTINGNAVTWGTHADKLANGFKVRTSSSSYNASGSNTFSVASFVDDFTDPNRAKANP